MELIVDFIQDCQLLFKDLALKGREQCVERKAFFLLWCAPSLQAPGPLSPPSLPTTAHVSGTISSAIPHFLNNLAQNLILNRSLHLS